MNKQSQHTRLKPGSYPSWDRISKCEINLRDSATSWQCQLTLDDLFEAIKEKLIEEGFTRD